MTEIVCEWESSLEELFSISKIVITMSKPARPESIEDLMKVCEKEEVEFVDIKFVDPLGDWRNVTLTRDYFTPEACAQGIAFDGSSIPAFQEIVESDLILEVVPDSAFMDPFCERPTLSVIAEVKDPLGEGDREYDHNPRYIARKAVAYMQKEGIADTMYCGPEVEFFIFDDVRFGGDGNYQMYEVDSDEGWWNSERSDPEGNHGNRSAHQGGYFRMLPLDSYKPLRDDMVAAMQEAGIVVERHHHEVGGTGQAEINVRYQDMVKQADQVMLYKYIVKNVAAAYGRTATFMPKPIFQENGSGMHVHQSLWKDGQPLFYDKDGYAGLSQMALWYIGGLLKHANAVLAIGAPGTNSYRRLTPGYEAPVVRAFSRRNRSAAIRIPVYHAENPAAKRLEFRSGDPLANPYLFFPAMLMAGLDGIKNKIEPGDPHDHNLFNLSEEERSKVKFVPSSLDEAINALEADHDFLTAGGVFSEDFIKTYISYKREKEIDAVRLRPHPHEFSLYYNS